MASRDASGIVMKYRVILGSVTVIGPPSSIWRLNFGTTEPLLPSTLPNLTATSVVSSQSLSSAWTIISATRFVAPMTFGGLTALSVEIITNFLALWWQAASAVFFVPMMLFLMVSDWLYSIIVQCLCATA